MIYNSQYLNQHQEDVTNEYLEVLGKHLDPVPYLKTGSTKNYGPYATIAQLIFWLGLATDLTFTEKDEAIFSKFKKEVIAVEVSQIHEGKQIARPEREDGQ